MNRFLGVVVAVLGMVQPLFAQIRLTPKQGSIDLIPKTVEISAQVRGSTCETTATYWFSNNADEGSQFEVDMECKVLPGQVITGFAYWFEDEKVPAFVVEKKRASSIYQSITSARRDPALIERIDRSTYRVRIFPVIGKQDLRVELKTAQAMVDGTFRWTIPSDVRRPLDFVRVQIDGLDASSSESWRTNWQLPQDGNRIRFEKQNVVPPAELRLSLTGNTETVRFRSFGAPSGSSVGYFSAVVWPGGSTRLSKPRVSGAMSYQLRKLGQTWVVTGQYRRGSRPSLTANGKQHPIALLASPQQNHAALKLWAEQEIESLGSKAANRGRVVQLSLRHGLSSPFTSLLAIPKAEREAFARVIAEEEIKSLVMEATRLHNLGPKQRSQAKSIETRMYAIQKKYNLNEGDMQNIAYGIRYVYLDLAAKRIASGKNLHEIASLEKDYELISRRYLKARTPSFKRYMGYECQDYVSTLSSDWLNGTITTSQYDQSLARLRKYTTITAGDLYDSLPYHQTRTAYATIWSHEYFGNQTPSSLKLSKTHVHRFESRYKNFGSHLKREGQTQAVWSRIKNLIDVYRPAEGGESPTQLLLAETEMQRDAIKRILVHPEAKRIGLDLLFSTRLFGMVAATDFESVLAASTPQTETQNLNIPKAVSNLGYGETEAKRAYEIALMPSYSGLFAQHSRTTLDRETIKTGEAKLEKLTTTLGLKDWKPFRSRLPQEFGYHWPSGYSYYYQNGTFSAFPGYYWDIGESEYYRGRYVQAVRANRSAQEIDQAAYEFDKSMRTSPTGYRYYYSSEKTPEYRKLRMQILYTEVVMDELKQEPKSEENEKRLAQLRERREDLRARFGDPIIQIHAPKYATMVYAIFPDGELKMCMWNEAAGVWEVRFDIPTYFKEGQYDVKITVVMPDGRRESQTFTYTADVKPPQAHARWTQFRGQWKLEVWSDPDTARAEVFFPDKRRYPMTKVGEGHFEYVANGFDPKTTVTIALTDKAHNRTQLEVLGKP